MGRAAFALRPVYARLFEGLKSSTKLFADETTAPVLDPGRGRTKTGQLWAYARDDRPWCGPEPPGVAYVYAPDRKHERPVVHLAGFKGTLQVDGYGAYTSLAERGDVVLAFCWSHVRRRFYEIQAASPAPIAAEALVRIGALYAIEADIRGCSAEQRQRVRFSRSKPLVDALKPWFETATRQPSRENRRPQKRSDMHSHAGTGSPASSTMAASRSIQTSSSAPSVPLRSGAKIISSPAPMAAANIGQFWPR